MPSDERQFLHTSRDASRPRCFENVHGIRLHGSKARTEQGSKRRKRRGFCLNTTTQESLSIIRFFVQGIPAPGGSKRFVGMSKRTGRAILIDAGGAKNKNWKRTVAHIGKDAWGNRPLLTQALSLQVIFTMPRPKCHYRTGKNAHLLREDAPQRPTTKPDTTKLLRSTEDALTGILWADDAQIVEQHASKRYGDTAGAVIILESVTT